MATTAAAEASANAPANPSPLNPHASSSSTPRRSLEQKVPLPTTSLVGSASSTPPEDLPAAAAAAAAADGLTKDTGAARAQPSLREALGRVRAGLGDSGPGTALSPATAGGGTLSPLGGGGGGGGRITQQQQAALERERQQNAVDRTDAVWAEMQQTLRDVELSAGVGTHFFGRGHPTALEELRQAQIALAQAWARGATDAAAHETAAERKDHKDKVAETSSSSSQKSPRAPASEADADDDETEADLAAARRRREASDRYFERVSKHVGEVTTKLEGVAVAMGKVEEESREGWSESDNLDSASQTS